MFKVEKVTDDKGRVWIQDPPIARFLFQGTPASWLWLVVRLLGSVAGTVLRTGPTPVLLVHPHTPAAAEGEKHLHASPTLESVI